MQRGGEQTVRVEHVHVYPGGQAVVGNVTHGGRGDGKCDNQPHTQGDVGAEVRGADTETIALPAAGNDQGQVPDARGRER